MSRKFKRNSPEQQAFLKLEGQKLLDVTDGGALLSCLGGLPVAAKIAEDSGLIKMAPDCIPEWRDPDALQHPLLLLLNESVLLAKCGLVGGSIKTLIYGAVRGLDRNFVA